MSVRSGAKFSMPGMMDTVLNLGLNEATLHGLIALTGNERFGWDAYRRFIQMFGRIVMGVDGERFDHALDAAKQARGVSLDTDLDAGDLRDVAAAYRAIVREDTGREFPEDPNEQLDLAIKAVFASWFGKRARDYRENQKIAHDLGTAVNVVTMVFGNMGDDSGTGVAFTRDPNTGEKVLFGEYLTNAQGEDVVAGIRTPQKIAQMREAMPAVYGEFERIAERLEKHYRDVQDLEFTIERGRLFMLQTRSAKRTAAAAVKIAADMVAEKVITKEEALSRIEPAHVDQLLRDQYDPAARASAPRIAKGLNASPGAAVGRAVFSADDAVELGRARREGRPRARRDLARRLPRHGRRPGHPDRARRRHLARRRRRAPDRQALRGRRAPSWSSTTARRPRARPNRTSASARATGSASTARPARSSSAPCPRSAPASRTSPSCSRSCSWADDVRRMGVWTNADKPEEAALARSYGAQGIGLCRTEHMFREGERLEIVRGAILVANVATRAKARLAAGETLDADDRHAVGQFDAAMAELEVLQQGDFEGIFKAMDGLPVVIRLIDPPLHEFLPNLEEQLVKVTLAGDAATPEDRELLAAIKSMHEQNPMLGLRGCRLGLMIPDFVKIQTRAILNAEIAVKRDGGNPIAKIMIPLVGHVNELRETRRILEAEALAVEKSAGVHVDYKFGTMIEVPRGALTADEIAEYADFFSFGTNDLTQMTFGYSRDDAEGGFLLKYVEDKILPANPFQTLDDAVAGLMGIAVAKGRATKPDLELGICGEHGGDPESIFNARSSASTTSPARPSACPSRAWPPPRPPSSTPPNATSSPYDLAVPDAAGTPGGLQP